ncbi:MAG: DUF2147 domain-containing protein [Pseudomonadota bacterium]|nr:DUF2147 domain-containing protein [Pseudomonadota bacterium]
MTLSLRSLCIGLGAVLATSLACAQATPVGLWKTIDDETKQPKAYIRIVETNGVYSGTLEKIIDPSGPPNAVCKACTDDRKDKPLVGLQLLRGVRQNADDKTVFDGGHILDPDKGTDYRVKLKPIEGGAKLEVRGFIGFALLGRTQTWLRAE